MPRFTTRDEEEDKGLARLLVPLEADWPKERLRRDGQRFGLFHGHEMASPRCPAPASLCWR